jgi:parvulin-like peptidyl-prolyl isomerase
MIVGPVRTPVGLHIIKIERIRGAERQARHILLRPQLAESDTRRALTAGDSVAEALRAGADLDSIADARSDPDELVRVGPLRQDSLPPAYAQPLAFAQQGQVVGPFELSDGPAPQVAVARVTEVVPARPATVDDYRTTILDQLAQAKLMDELLQELRRSTYIEVRLPDAGGGVASGR